MKKIKYFQELLVDNYTTTKLGVDYKIIDDTLYLQQSKQKTDWIINFIFLPMPSLRMKKPFIHLGFLLSYLAIRKIVKNNKISTVVGYSKGAAVAQVVCLYNEHLDAICFASPKPFFLPIKKNIKVTVVNEHTDIVSILPPFFWNIETTEKIGKKGIPSVKGHYPEVYLEDLC